MQPYDNFAMTFKLITGRIEVKLYEPSMIIILNDRQLTKILPALYLLRHFQIEAGLLSIQPFLLRNKII